MNASYNKERGYSNGIIDIMAKEDNEKDIAHMERVVAFLKENYGYEEIAGDGDYNIIITGKDTIEDMKKQYAEAKKATK